MRQTLLKLHKNRNDGRTNLKVTMIKKHTHSFGITNESEEKTHDHIENLSKKQSKTLENCSSKIQRLNYTNQHVIIIWLCTWELI